MANKSKSARKESKRSKVEHKKKEPTQYQREKAKVRTRRKNGRYAMDM